MNSQAEIQEIQIQESGKFSAYQLFQKAGWQMTISSYFFFAFLLGLCVQLCRLMQVELEDK